MVVVVVVEVVVVEVVVVEVAVVVVMVVGLVAVYAYDSPCNNTNLLYNNDIQGGNGCNVKEFFFK